MNKKIAAILLFSSIAMGGAFLDQEAGAVEEGEMELTLERAVELVVTRNLSLKSAKREIVMSDTELQHLRSRYQSMLKLEGGYSRQNLPPSGMSEFTGDRMYQWDASAMIAKYFSTGTTVAAGVKSSLYDANDPRMEFMGMVIKEKDPAFYRPSAFVSVQQELLKNSFGLTDRIQERILENAAAMRKRAVVDAVSGLVAGALAGYWEVTVGKSLVENALFELESTRTVRNVIEKNVRFGLMDVYGLHQFNVVTAVAEAKLEVSTQAYGAAVRNLLRILNLPLETRIRPTTSLTASTPVISLPSALKSAFAKRVDYRNALLAVENADLEKKMYENHDLPSVSVDMNLATQGQDESQTPAAREVTKGEYPSWSVYLRMSYPIGDSGQAANRRNAALRLEQSRLEEERLKTEIRDDVTNRIELARLRHTVLVKAGTARNAAQLYYRRVLGRFGMGKASSLDMKDAIDAMTQTRQQELESLVAYNIALLQLDVAKNEIFERYNIDINKIQEPGER